MSKSNRKRYSVQFKAKIALEALRGEETAARRIWGCILEPWGRILPFKLLGYLTL